MRIEPKIKNIRRAASERGRVESQALGSGRWAYHLVFGGDHDGRIANDKPRVLFAVERIPLVTMTLMCTPSRILLFRSVDQMSSTRSWRDIPISRPM